MALTDDQFNRLRYELGDYYDQDGLNRSQLDVYYIEAESIADRHASDSTVAVSREDVYALTMALTIRGLALRYSNAIDTETGEAKEKASQQFAHLVKMESLYAPPELIEAEFGVSAASQSAVATWQPQHVRAVSRKQRR